MGMLRPEIVTLVAARPGMGKTALLLTLANGVNKSGAGVHVVNLEDGEGSYARRTISLGSGVDTTNMSALSLTKSDMASMMQMAESARKRTGWVVDSTAGKTASEIVRDVRMSANDNGTRVVVVDYIQLIKGESEAGKRDKKTRLAEAMTIFAEAAKRDNMAYVVGSQLNRDCEKRDDKRPLASDTSGCGELEEMSKAILMIYRPAEYGDKYAKGQYKGKEYPGQTSGQPIPGNVMELLVRKNNDGLTGTVLVDWQPERMRIR
jgi:replicative DNA helicase